MRYIESFKAAWYDLGLPTTCKMHLLIEHLPEEFAHYGMGTALLNESASESLHADFDKHYQGFKNSCSSILFQFEFDDC